ncbi:3 beta-hydroxysteroid dehydrogenase/Delta 5--_4-isomerase (plasmid) [Pseudoseohaeicola sp. NH-UV-7]|uniref:NAD-dependent epimerase/dehydratase family protein n=1 Tax=Sulfitobacter sp. TBRI5 TaxID=2989732 RepID=UPI003A716704
MASFSTTEASPAQEILVTGGTGLIGHFLVEKLCDQGHNVTVLARSSSTSEAVRAFGANIVEGDVRDADSLRGAVTGFDTVYHLAVQRHGQTAKGHAIHRAGDRRTTVDGPINVLEAAAAGGARRFLHVSSAGVLGRKSQSGNELTAPDPDRPYRVLRLEAEHKLAKRAKALQLPTVIARSTHVYGPRDRNWLPVFQLIASNNLTIIGDGKKTEHVSFVEDIANGLIAAMEHADLSVPIFMVGSPAVPFWEFLNTIAEKTGGSVRRRSWLGPVLRPVAKAYDVLNRPADKWTRLGQKFDFHINGTSYDLGKSRDMLNTPPPVPLEEAVARTAAWYRNEGLL